jgi:hypothetical protein
MVAVAAALVSSNIAMAQDKCDLDATNLPVVATVSGSIKSVGFIAGARWGEGVLTMKSGEQRRFDILGVKLVETGAARTEFEGEVYNLNHIEDFVGTYIGAGTGIAVIAGKGEAVVNNGRCVIVKVRGYREGVQMSAPAPSGVEISWD